MRARGRSLSPRYDDPALCARARVVWPFYGHGHAALSHLATLDGFNRSERYRGEARGPRRDADEAAERARLARDCALARVATMMRAPAQRTLSDPLHHFTSPAGTPKRGREETLMA